MVGSGSARMAAPMRVAASSQETGRYLSCAASYAIGWVRRPWSSSAWSVHSHSSDSVCCAKNSGVVRLEVASQVIALAPFSQNSNEEVWRGSGQAQPGQSKPSGLLARCSASTERATAIWSRIALATARSAPQPPAGPS
jgi:hypothetical protein